ncbi:hypothetical protein [Alishewanella longhuensis]
MTDSPASSAYWQAQYASLSTGLTVSEQQQLSCLLKASTFIGRTLQQQSALIPVFCQSHLLQQQLAQGFANPLPVASPPDETNAFALLRRYRNAGLAQILAADILGLQSISQSLAAVSALAEVLINSAYHWAYQQQAAINGTPLDEQGEPMPLLILGMGKLGGGELNFSSDIDLIFTYPANGETVGGRKTVEHQQFFTKVGQKLIAALHQVTADGFCYRVDMRLRPFGESGPLVLSFGRCWP